MARLAFGLYATLKTSPKPSSTQELLDQMPAEFARHDADTSSGRVADHNVRPGVTHDEGDDDAWPMLRGTLMKVDIPVMSTPTRMEQPSSLAKRVLERLDANRRP